MGAQQDIRDLSHGDIDIRSFDESGIQRNSHPTDLQDLPFNGLICESEEMLQEVGEVTLTDEQIILVSVRCVITFICLVGAILVIVATSRSRQQRYKSWRLYLLTTLMVWAWMSLSLYRGI